MEATQATSTQRGAECLELVFLGTVTVSTPCETVALTASTLVLSGRRKRRRNLLCDLSTRCHLSSLSTPSWLLSPEICSVFPSSTVTFTSSFAKPADTSPPTESQLSTPHSLRTLRLNHLQGRGGGESLEVGVETREICFEDVRVRGLLPVHSGARHGSHVVC